MHFEEKTLRKYLLEKSADNRRVVVAFDGFVDEIKRVVKSRTPDGRPVLYRGKADFLADLAGEECNKDLELITSFRKMGGSAALTAHALAQAGVHVDAWITAGSDPVFLPLTQKAGVHIVGEPPLTWALELENGKIMLSDRSPLAGLDWETFKKRADYYRFVQAVGMCDAVMLMGYAMLRCGEQLYRGVLQEVLRASKRKPRVLIDLADISREEKSCLEALRVLLKEIGNTCETTVLLNRNEAIALAGGETSSRRVIDLAQRAADALYPCGVVLHTPHESVLCGRKGPTQVFHPKVETAAVKTGCGDHFCAGFCLGELLNLPPREQLQLAGLTARSYMEHGESPTWNMLLDSLETEDGNAPAPLRMIAMDFDGTILDATHRIPAHTLEILWQAKGAGYLLCACTGRSYRDTLRLIGENHPFDYAVTSNGGDIHDLSSGRQLERITISSAAAAQVMSVLDQHPVYYEAYIDGQPWAEESKVALLQETSDIYADYISGGGDLVRHTGDMRTHLFATGKEVTKFYVMAGTEETAGQIRKTIRKISGIRCTSSGPANLEVLHRDVDKALALKTVGQAAGIAMEQILALGDGENDANMLHDCGYGVAMGNAQEAAAAAARFICPPVDCEGATDAIRYFCLS